MVIRVANWTAFILVTLSPMKDLTFARAEMNTKYRNIRDVDMNGLELQENKNLIAIKKEIRCLICKQGI